MKYGIKKEVFKDIINTFKKYEKIEEAYIFGSRARGDYKDISDIDIALLSSDDISLKVKRDLEEIRCILTFDVVDFNSIGPKLKSNIEKDKICIYKKN